MCLAGATPGGPWDRWAQDPLSYLSVPCSVGVPGLPGVSQLALPCPVVRIWVLFSSDWREPLAPLEEVIGFKDMVNPGGKLCLCPENVMNRWGWGMVRPLVLGRAV